MKSIKVVVRRWQKDRFSHNERWIMEYEETLKALVTEFSSLGFRNSKACLENIRNLLVELNQLKFMEESMWRQKSKILWFKDGECNTAYFHKIGSCRKRANVITHTLVGLKEKASVSKVKRTMTNVFQGCFKSPQGVHVEDWNVAFPQLNQSYVNLFKISFTEGNVHWELMNADGNKVSGQDSFTFKFAKAFWPKLKGKILNLFNHF